MENSLLSNEPHTVAERVAERTIFASRWLLAPFYVGLAFSLLVLLIKFAQNTVKLVSNALVSNSNDVITDVLSLIDLCLVASLLLIVMFASYENFVSRLQLEDNKYRPSWMGRVDFGDLKVKLLTSIVAIAAIHVLESFMNIGPTSDRELAWSVGILVAFVVSELLLAIMDRLSAAGQH
jgi:uncharacterized protein (TIGR00645 family)